MPLAGHCGGVPTAGGAEPKPRGDSAPCPSPNSLSAFVLTRRLSLPAGGEGRGYFSLSYKTQLKKRLLPWVPPPKHLRAHLVPCLPNLDHLNDESAPMTHHLERKQPCSGVLGSGTRVGAQELWAEAGREASQNPQRAATSDPGPRPQGQSL